MILVVNLNASLDKRYEMTDLLKGCVMRAKTVDNTPGGKGLHVANVLTILGGKCIATGMLGGRTGEFIVDKLKEYGIKHDFMLIQGETRSCLAIVTEDGQQTEILEPGPFVSVEEQDRFILHYEMLLEKADLIVASGSVPQNIPVDFYVKMIEMAQNKGKKFFLDTSGPLLKENIRAKPYFIKPNQAEIETLTGRKIANIEDLVFEIKNFMTQGIRMAVVSLGRDGAMIGYAGKIYKVTVPKVEAVNPVGSGDAFVAGMALAVYRGYSFADAVKNAAACGTANVMEKESGFVHKNVVESLKKEITINEFLADN